MTTANTVEATECVREGVDECVAPVDNAETAGCLRNEIDENMAPVSNAEAAECLRELLVIAGLERRSAVLASVVL